jgi:acyl dehydratase
MVDALVMGDRRGPVILDVTPDLVERYRKATGDTVSPRIVRYLDTDISVAPPMILCLAVNRAAREFPSPPGSVHARQRFEFLRPVEIGHRLNIYVAFGGAENQRGRSMVTLDLTVEDENGALVATAQSKTLWA